MRLLTLRGIAALFLILFALWGSQHARGLAAPPTMRDQPLARRAQSVVGYNNLVVGAGAAQSLWGGSCDIIIGHDDVPTPDTSYYLNIDGTVYPNSARWDPEFQSLARRRTFELAREMGMAIDPAVINYYFAKDLCVSGEPPVGGSVN